MDNLTELYCVVLVQYILDCGANLRRNCTGVMGKLLREVVFFKLGLVER